MGGKVAVQHCPAPTAARQLGSNAAGRVEVGCPPDLLFLQRKFVGTFMLCSRLQARLDVGALFGGHL
jgi:hypothetical protein